LRYGRFAAESEAYLNRVVPKADICAVCRMSVHRWRCPRAAIRERQDRVGSCPPVGGDYLRPRKAVTIGGSSTLAAAVLKALN